MEEELDDLLSQMNSSTDTPTASVSERLQSVPNRPKLKKIKRPKIRQMPITTDINNDVDDTNITTSVISNKAEVVSVYEGDRLEEPSNTKNTSIITASEAQDIVSADNKYEFDSLPPDLDYLEGDAGDGIYIDSANYMKKKYPSCTNFEVILYGSLALTGKGHLTDKILLDTLGKNTKVSFNYLEEKEHPNTLIIKANVNGEIFEHEFISVGGGNILLKGETLKKEDVYPFKNFDDIKYYALKNNMSLVDIVLKHEKDIYPYLEEVYKAMYCAIKRGLTKEGLLPGGLNVERRASTLYGSIIAKDLNEDKRLKIVSSFAYAVSEENASGGIIVTAPTCGACGILPAVLFYIKKKKRLPKKKIIEALCVAGIFGNVVRENAAISGAFAGCQSEVGTACAMASAAASYLLNGTIDEMECAAEMALEHNLGLTCDPIAGLVQIPCIERNAGAAVRALDNATLAPYLSKSRKISFDMIVKTMYETGRDLKSEYKETSTGGLAKFYTKQGC